MNTSQIWGPRVPSLMFEKRRLNVLLVDHEPNVHASIVGMLEHYFHKVTCVKYASTGLSILSRGSPKVDVVMENIKSPDLCGFKLLQDAVERDLHVILLLDEDDYVLTKMAVEAGALICITKPVTMGMTECLWQIVVGEKLRRIRRRNNLINNMNMNMNMNIQEQEQMSMEVTSYDMISDEETCSTDITSANSTKVWTEWTQELHDLFMDAVRKLGDGKCYPKDILELMNVPGLTRMQVASHLQKCRSGTWLPPNKRKPKVGDTTTTSVAKSRRFGFMPRLATNPNNIHHTITNNVDVGVGVDAGAGDQTIYIGSVGLTNWGVGVGVGVDGTLPPNEQLQLVVDHAQSAAPTTNASPLNQNDECFDEFPNIDSLIGGLICLFDEGPISYAVDDIDMVYSNLQVPVMSNADVDKWEEASEADNDAKTQVVIKKK